MRRHNRFEMGSSTFICQVCERRTRNTGQDVDHLCSDCFDIAGIDNTINDGGYKPGTPDFDEFIPELTQHIKRIAKLGGNVTKVLASNTFAFPKTVSIGDTDMTAIDYSTMSKKELHTAAKAAGIKYGKLSLMQIREALSKVEPTKAEPAKGETKAVAVPTKAAKKGAKGDKKSDEPKVRKERTGTKMILATEIVKKNPNLPRKAIIAKFISDVKLTKAGANTYYSLITKKLATK